MEYFPLQVHPKVVQDMLGHRTITTTMDTYSHVMPVLHGDAVRRLDRILRREHPKTLDDAGAA